MISSQASGACASSSSGRSTLSIEQRTAWPIGSLPSRNCFTNDWFTTAKWAARPTSASLKNRPVINGMRKAENSCGLISPNIASAPVSEGLLRISILPRNPPKGGKNVMETPALSTPGVSPMACRTASMAFNRPCHVGNAPLGKATSRLKMCSGSKPNGV